MTFCGKFKPSYSLSINFTVKNNIDKYNILEMHFYGGGNKNCGIRWELDIQDRRFLKAAKFKKK